MGKVLVAVVFVVGLWLVSGCGAGLGTNLAGSVEFTGSDNTSGVERSFLSMMGSGMMNGGMMGKGHEMTDHMDNMTEYMDNVTGRMGEMHPQGTNPCHTDGDNVSDGGTT